MDPRSSCLKILSELLTLPGNGVYTVHTGKNKKDALLKSYYQTVNSDKAKLKWLKSLEKLSSDKPWILGLPSDNGGGIQRGANWGPLYIRQEIVPDRNQFLDLGDVRVIPHLLHDKYLNASTIKECQRALYGKVNNLPVSPLSIAERALNELYQTFPDARILGLGGDHSNSYPLVKTWMKSRKVKKKAALLHFDAHTDLMDRRLGIDLCFGTWTYQILKVLPSPSHIIQVGIRSSGQSKKYWKEKVGVEQIWAKEVKKDGVAKISKKIISHYKKLGIEELYVSFDIDALDEAFASATGTPEKSGLLPSDCCAMIRIISQEFKVTGADVMELAPLVCPEGTQAKDRASSLIVAADMTRVLLHALKL